MGENPVLASRPFNRKRWNEDYQHRLQRFDELKSINVETKNDLYDLVAPLIEKSVEAERKLSFVKEFSMIFFLLISFFFLFISVIPLYNSIVDYIFVKESNLYIIQNTITEITFWVSYAILMIPFLLMLRSRGILVFMIIIISLLIIETFIFTQNWDKNAHYIINGIAAANLIALFNFIYFLLFNRVFNYYEEFLKLRIFSRYSLPILVERLIYIIYRSETAGNGWIQLEYKQDQLSSLELAAKSLEKYLLQCSQENDIVTNIWVKETAEQVANAIREKKTWILTPKNNTNVYFIEKITSTLLCILNGNWDALERVKFEKPSSIRSQHSLISFLLNLLKIVFIMGLPIIVFGIFQLAPIAIPETFRGYIVIGLFLWELLTLLVVFDPNVGTKVSAMRDLASLFPSRSDGKS